MKKFFVELAYVMVVAVGVGIISIAAFIHSGNKIYATNVFILGLIVECVIFVIKWRLVTYYNYLKSRK